MTVQGIIGAIGAGLLVLMSFVEVSKIKINPWSWIAKHIGRAVNGEMMDAIAGMKKDIGTQIDDVKKDVQELREKQEVSDAERKENDAKATRTRILRFGDEVYMGIRHSKEHFDQILADVTEYNDYCKDHPNFKNERTKKTVQHIEEVYEKCLREGDFLGNKKGT